MLSGRPSDNNDGESRNQPCFEDPKEEALYWKEIAEDYIQKLQDMKDEFDEFQEGSRELELEFEAQLEQYEQRVNELVDTKCKLEEENELLKEKLETTERQTYKQITELQDENVQIKAVRDEMSKYIRELEQANDDLERAKRATISSLEEFDARLNTAIERNAFLESELEEKEQIIITVQRLKDETRDLRGELSVRSQGRNALNESKLRLIETQLNAIETATIDGSKQTEPNSPKKVNSSKCDRSNNITPISALTPRMTAVRNSANSMTPSARVSALNIVSDLLRKVGALESKLASCRNFVHDNPRNGKTQMIHGVIPITDAATMMNGSGMNGNQKSNSNNISGLVQVNV